MFNKNKWQSLLHSICITIISLSLGYAALQETLNINAEATIGSLKSNWNVHFSQDGGLEGTTTGSAEAGTMTLNNTDVTINNVKLKAPGDSVTYTFYVENSGDLNAKLASYTKKEPTITASGEKDTEDKSLVEQNYEFSIKWADDVETEITADGSKLPSKQKKKIKVVISYKSSAQQLPEEEVNITGLGATLVYEQDTDA